MKYVQMKSMKELVRKKIIEIVHLSDDGEYCRYKILPGSVEISEWCRFGNKLMVVSCETVHEHQLKVAPQLYEDCDKNGTK